MSDHQPLIQDSPPPPRSQPLRPKMTSPDDPIYKSEVPNEDVHEKNATMQAQPTTSSVPPLSSMDQVARYESAGFQADAFIPPPSHEQVTAPQPEESSTMQPDIPVISEDEAREALLREVATHSCYGKGAARRLVISKITPSSAFHVVLNASVAHLAFQEVFWESRSREVKVQTYQLETFTEGRQTAWVYQPYTGQLIDGSQNGPAPGPWDITAQPPFLFQNSQKHFEVPHTASVKVCHGCMGNGFNRCSKCLGSGKVTCGTCNGSGRIMQPVYHHPHHHYHHGHFHHHGGHFHMRRVCCHSCNGSGQKRCSTCSGSGQLKCQVCHAYGRLKCYIQLTVTWKTTKADHIVEHTALPDHLIPNAQGRIAFQDQRPKVAPVTNFPDRAVNAASSELVQFHAIGFPDEKIIMQRHWIRMVPVSEVACTWKGKSFNYWVYGYNTLVYDPDYPQKMCWGCTLF